MQLIVIDWNVIAITFQLIVIDWNVIAIDWSVNILLMVYNEEKLKYFIEKLIFIYLKYNW